MRDVMACCMRVESLCRRATPNLAKPHLTSKFGVPSRNAPCEDPPPHMARDPPAKSSAGYGTIASPEPNLVLPI